MNGDCCVFKFYQPCVDETDSRIRGRVLSLDKFSCLMNYFDPYDISQIKSIFPRIIDYGVHAI